MTRLVVSLHDVAPATAEQSRRWLELLEARSLRTSLLVVPGPWRGGEFRRAGAFHSWLRRAESNGHEVVLHGWEHNRPADAAGPRGRVGALMARGCEEFWSASYADAMRRLSSGLNVLRDEGFNPTGFVAPGWLMSPDTISALRTCPLRYTVTHTRLIDLESLRDERIFVTSQRPASSVGRPLALATRALLASQTVLARPVRVAIHPADIAEPSLRRTNLMLCDAALGHGYTSLTYQDLHHRLFGNGSRTNIGSNDSDSAPERQVG